MPRWIIALMCAVIFTLLFWLVLPPEYAVSESTDYDAFYRPEAQEILRGHGFSLPDGTPALRVPPGYLVIVAGVPSGNENPWPRRISCASGR